MEKSTIHPSFDQGSDAPKYLMLSLIPQYLYKVESTTNFTPQEMTHHRQLLSLSFYNEKRLIPYTVAQLQEKMSLERVRFEKLHSNHNSDINKAFQTPKEIFKKLNKLINKNKVARADKVIASNSTLLDLKDIIAYARKKNNDCVVKYCVQYAMNRADYINLPSANLIELHTHRNAVINPQNYSLPFKNPVTKLHICAELGDMDIVREYLKEFRVDIKDYRYIQALHMAVKAGNMNTVICLVTELKKLMIPLTEVVDIYGKNALMYAMIMSSDEHVDIVNYLLEIEPALVRQKDTIGFTALDYAICRSNNIRMIDLLISFRAEFNIIPCGIDTLNIFYYFYIRTKWIDQSLLKQILERIQNIHPEFIKLPIRQLPSYLYPEYIDQLIYLNQIDEATRLLNVFVKNNGDVNYVLPNTDTLLFSAIKKKNIHLVLTLIDLGADVNFKNKALHTPLSVAIERHADDIVQALANNENVDLNVLLFDNQEGYLHLVIKYKYLFALKVLFEKLFWDRDKMTLFGSTLIDFCIAFDFKDGIDIIMPHNNSLKDELVARCSLDFSQRTEKCFETLTNVAKHGIISRRKIYDLGLNCTYSHDPKEFKLESIPDRICVNLITKKEAIKQSVTTRYCGSLTVTIERQNESINRNQNKISANAIYELTRRANSSFVIITSKKKLISSCGFDQYLPMPTCGTTEYKLKDISPSQIDLILFPYCLHPFKERITAIFGHDITIKFLNDIPSDQFKPEPNTIYVDFVPYDKEIIYFGSTLVEAFSPSYAKSVYLEKYFDIVGGDLFTHIVRADGSFVTENNAQPETNPAYDDSISDVQLSFFNLDMRLLQLRLSYYEHVSDTEINTNIIDSNCTI